MTGRELATLELQALLAEPSVGTRWPGGLATDDVVSALHVDRPGARPDPRRRTGAKRAPHGMPRVRGRAPGRHGGLPAGRGRTLTAAALRCLIAAEARVDDEVQRGLIAPEAEVDDEVQRGLAVLGALLDAS